MNQPPPPLPFGWSANWDPATGTNTFTETSTGRTQSHFPSNPSFVPNSNSRISSPPQHQQQQYPNQQQQQSRHSSNASIGVGGKMSSPPQSFSPQLQGGRRPSPGNPLQQGYPQQQQQHQQQQQQHDPNQQQHQQEIQPPPAPAPARASRRQYAANTGAYIAGEPAQQPMTNGNAPLPGHGHSNSLSQGGNSSNGGGQFFSPAANDPSASPYIQSSTQPSYTGGMAGAPTGPTGNSGVGGMAGYLDPAANNAGYQQQGQVPYGGPGGPGGPAGVGSGGVGGLNNQFNNMNLGAAKPLTIVPGLNLIGLPLSPAELFSLEPPEIRLPMNASFSNSETRNCDPSYQRSTINAVPTTASLLSKSKLPLALVITPYRSIKPGDAPVPVVSDTVIARCRRCRTYINPYVTFIEGGHRWKCCMCNLSNETPQLFDWDQENNQPTDRYLRPELNNAVVEFVAPTEYMVRPPQPPIYIFIIDVSHAAINSGMVATAARTLLESLDRIPNEDSRTKISIIAVDSCLHFFSLPAGATEPQMLVVGDLEDVFLPKPSDLLVNIVEAKAALESLLGRLSDMFKETHDVGSALGAALQAAFKLVSHVGGKVLVLTSTLPNLGPGALKMREDSKLFGTVKESTLLQPQNNFYKNFAIECSRSQVSVDMWLFSSAYTDVATLSGLPRYTGGQTYLYPSFNAARSEDALKFAHEFGTVVADPIALEAVMRVRASKGIRMSSFHGNFFVRSTDLLSLAAVPMDQSYAIEIQIEDPISAPFVVFQTAVLHTTCYGERRIRVITLALPTTTSMQELYSSVDTVAMATLLTDKAVERSMGSKLEDARDAVSNKLVDILGTYKANMTSTGSGASPALAISENMKFLPLLMLGLLKHVGIRQSAVIPSDFRAYAQALLTTLPSQLLMPYLHPVFYSLHNMPKECGTIGDYGVVLPIPLNLSAEKLERHGLFLMEDGQNIFLWVGRDAVPQLVMDVFDIGSYAELRAGKQTLPVLENSFSQRINAIIGKIREARRGPYYAHLFVVKEDGEPSLRQWALSTLIEDRMDSLPSYGQWLGTLKDKVNDKNF